MSFTVRPATFADATRLAEVHVAAWRETYGHVVDADVLANFDVAERVEMWTHILGTDRHPDAVTVVGEADGFVVGFATAMPPRHPEPAREWELVSLYTLASVHGTGIGTALLDATVGERPAEVWLLSANDRATAFYRKHGFDEDGATGFFELWRQPEKRMVR